MILKYKVEGNEFLDAGRASSNLKKKLKQLGISPEIIRKVSITMYEAEINMVIHANGGEIKAEITPDKIYICLEDEGPGIKDLDLAMQEGYSTASDEAREMGFGAGMGLPNMKRNSDKLEISSELGKGTKVEFTVFLK